MTKLILIKAFANYADEFDINGHLLLSGEQAERAVAAIEDIDNLRNSEICFGTNESIMLHDISFVVDELTEEQYHTIGEFFTGCSGTLSVECVLDVIEESQALSAPHNAFTEWVNGIVAQLKSEGVDYYDAIRNEKFKFDSLILGGFTFKYESNGYYNQDVRYVLDSDELYAVFRVEDYITYADFRN